MRNTVRALLASLCMLAAFSASAAAQLRMPTSAEIDAVFAEFTPATPGCMLGVIHDGRVVFQRGYGSANLDYGLANGPEMVYYVGSVSKQFTAAAIALLSSRGALSLDDDVRRYIPELPDYGRTMTVRHLVHHTSGLRDIYTLMSLAGIRMEDVFTDADALALITRQKQLNFMPGDDYLYSNSGYWLLGQIVERVTGRSLRQFAHDELFVPLGMTRTRFHDDPGSILPNRVMSYTGGAGALRIAYLSNFDKVGAGGLYTTLADLAKWDANFYDGRVGGAPFLDLMHTRGVLNRGDTLAYAFGINVQQRRGLDMVRHSGSLMGFRADLVRYPTQRFTVATMCNHAAVDASAFADRVAELYLGNLLQPVVAQQRQQAATPVAQQTTPQPHDVTPERARLLAGRYYSEELDATYLVDVAGDGLRLTRRLTGTQPLRPAPALDSFAAGTQTVSFERDPAGTGVAFTVQAGRVRNIRFVRVP
jgi:CubicO group peptidase (beta-lactamase class C family)